MLVVLSPQILTYKKVNWFSRFFSKKVVFFSHSSSKGFFSSLISFITQILEEQLFLKDNKIYHKQRQGLPDKNQI